jgi:hypothetical protein
MKLEDIPRREEILILTEAHQRLDRVLVSQHFDRRVASFAEIAHVARAVWIGTLRGTPMTAEQIARTIGMPCSTVMSKLGYLIRHGHICQDGNVYRVADKVLATRTPALDRASLCLSRRRTHCALFGQTILRSTRAQRSLPPWVRLWAGQGQRAVMSAVCYGHKADVDECLL